MRQAGRCDPPRTTQARAVLDALLLVPLLTRITQGTGTLGPPSLRSLDALHLMTALELGDDLEAARHLGLPVLTPR